MRRIECVTRSRRAAERWYEAEAGISLIETITAAALLLFLAVGVVPMMTRALVNNVRGGEASVASAHARSHLESMVQLPFNSGPLALQAGLDERRGIALWDAGTGVEGDAEEGWSDTTTATTRHRWRRTSTVRQLNVSDLHTPVAGGTAQEFVHLKQVEVRLEGFRQGTLGAGQRHTVHVLKAF